MIFAYKSLVYFVLLLVVFFQLIAGIRPATTLAADSRHMGIGQYQRLKMEAAEAGVDGEYFVFFLHQFGLHLSYLTYFIIFLRVVVAGNFAEIDCDK